MPEDTSLLDGLHGIASRLDGDMSEKDVENTFLNEDFYSLLGYEGAGHDLRSEWTLPNHRRPDYVTLDDNESVTAVYEFKTTGRDLTPHEDQLFHYVDELKADYGVLTNGEELRLYRREDQVEMLAVTLSEVTESEVADLKSILQKPDWDISNPESVTEFLNRLEEVELDNELGREHFFDTFRLDEESPFANLVTALMDLLKELRDDKEAKFVKGAYDFWEATYANIPEETPDSWEPFVEGEESLHDFMFALESGHALLARLLLAKATEDHDFFPTNRGFERYFNELGGGFSDSIDLDAYPIAANGMIEEMRRQLVESLFEDDIFIWWTDGYGEETASQHQDQFSRFRDVAKSGSSVTKVSPSTRERFSRSVAHVAFAVLKFDFSRIEGDPLGDLYQQYFDPETRKALGEFYTPQPVVDYILDGVGYDQGVANDRIIDPSCGSGTFLVEAVNRYIDDVKEYNEDPDWAEELTELCSRPAIVGLDIHPFAVLMAQIRFMVAILPEYRSAKQQDESFTIHRLPIFRTDTLRNERELTGIDLGNDGQTQMTLDAVTEDNQDVRIPVPLPIEVEEDENIPESARDGRFLKQRVRMPLFETVQLNSGVRNFGEYFAALQGVLDVVKFHMSEGEWKYVGGLEQGINRYTTQNYDGVEDFFKPYVNDILDTVRYLKEDHGDGRLFKMFEDTVLAVVVKNYMTYDYVVGNPPYVNIKNVKESKQTWYNELYDSAFGRFDLYVLFLEKGLGMLSENGKLGFITSNKFAKSKYGKEIRRIIGSEYALEQYIDFGDTGVFEDAVNYPCILIIGRELNLPADYAKVRKQIDGPLDEIGTRIGKDEYVSDDLEVSSYPQTGITEENWRFIPSQVREIGASLVEQSPSTIGDISLGVREGVAPGGDDAFIVSPEYADENELEDELLLPIIRGGNVRRWTVKWEDEFAIYPYGPDGKLIDLSSFPNVKSHLDEWEGYLQDRYCVNKGGKGIYEYHGPHAKSVYEGEFKIATPDMATENQFSFTNGHDCFKNTAYVLTFPADVGYSEKELLGILNSSIAEFIVKQNSPYVNSKYFRYKTQYVNPIPLPPSPEGIEEIVDRILYLEKQSRKTESFPDSYLQDYTGEIDYVEYEWKTKRNPVDAEIDTLKDGRMAVKAGRTDEITSPTMDTGNMEEKRLRARYIHSAVDGQDVSKGEKQTIPIPKTKSDIHQLLNQLEEDSSELQNSSVPDLESKIDDIMYEQFGLAKAQQDLVEDYIQIFR